jgi:hypothetical protein
LTGPGHFRFTYTNLAMKEDIAGAFYYRNVFEIHFAIVNGFRFEHLEELGQMRSIVNAWK